MVPPFPPRPTGASTIPPSQPPLEEELEDLSLEIELEEDEPEDGIAYDPTVPVEERAWIKPRLGVSPVASPHDGAPVLLVIDDDDSIRSLVTAGLAPRYTIYEAKDGEEALEVLEQMPTPDAIVCDIMMPKLDGLSLVRTLKTRGLTRTIPVIFLTAKDKPLDVIQGINAGARHYLSKPFKMKELIEKVDAIASKSGPRSSRR